MTPNIIKHESNHYILSQTKECGNNSIQKKVQKPTTVRLLIFHVRVLNKTKQSSNTLRRFRVLDVSLWSHGRLSRPSVSTLVLRFITPSISRHSQETDEISLYKLLLLQTRLELHYRF